MKLIKHGIFENTVALGLLASKSLWGIPSITFEIFNEMRRVVKV